MQMIFGSLYAVVFLGYMGTALFICYHLLRYSGNRKQAVFTTALFLSVLGVLLATNVVTFLSLPLDELLPKMTL